MDAETPMRQILVNCCIQCPYCDRNGGYNDRPETYRCKAVRTEQVIEDPMLIPQWCPLPVCRVTLSGNLLHSDEALQREVSAAQQAFQANLRG